MKPYYLIWHFLGALRGQRFADWNECEAFSKKLIAAGLCPELTLDSPCPYDTNQGTVYIDTSTPAVPSRNP